MGRTEVWVEDDDHPTGHWMWASGAEVWVEDDDNPSGHWVWAGGYVGGGDEPAPPAAKFLSLPGTAGAVASVPTASAFNVSAHKLRMRMRKTSWTPATNQVLVSKWTDADGGQSWFWRLQTGGWPYFIFTTNGASDTASPIPTSSTPPAADTVVWVQFEVFASDRHIEMSTHPDQVSEPTSGWTVVSTGAASGSSLGTIFASTTPLVIGSTAGGTYQPLQADIFQMCIRNAADALVFQLDPQLYASGSNWVTSTGHTVTMQGTASIGVDS